MGWIVVGALFLAGLVYVMVLPMREAPFRVVEHEISRAQGAPAIVGRLRNGGETAPRLLVEAYLYGGDDRYLGTARTVLETVPGDATVPFRIPLSSRFAGRVERYSLYAGDSPNPFAPEPR